MEKYNGWSNYETWLINIWCDEYQIINPNPKDLRAEVEDLIDTVISDGILSKASLAADLLYGSLQKVNWEELAQHHAEYMEDCNQATS